MRVDFDRFVAELPREVKAGAKRMKRGAGIPYRANGRPA
jgi:hypothetical protein